MTDETLQELVRQEFEWEPGVSSAHIRVTAKDAAVTLNGHVRSCSQRLAAVQAAVRVHGVRSVADELEVKLPATRKRDDSAIAESAARYLSWSTAVPSSVHAEVRSGVLTLRGEVKLRWQRAAAESAVLDLPGVTAVVDEITVRSRDGLAA